MQLEQRAHETFVFHKLVNPRSVCGYPYLAINQEQTMYISFSSGHISIEAVYWEVHDWLQTDYIQTTTTFYFQISHLEKWVADKYHERAYTMTFYYNQNNELYNVVLTLGKVDTYREQEFTVCDSAIFGSIGKHIAVLAQQKNTLLRTGGGEVVSRWQQGLTWN